LQVQQELAQPVQQQVPAWMLPGPEPEPEQQQVPELLQPVLLLFSCSQLRMQEPL